jgi:hypothetical protein
VALDPVVQDEADQQLLHVSLRDVQRAADEWQAHTRVRLDQLQQHLHGSSKVMPKQQGCSDCWGITQSSNRSSAAGARLAMKCWCQATEA